MPYPYVGLTFWVEMDGVQVAGFAECSGITAETEVYEYSEGGENTYTHKLPVRTKWGNITLKRGLDEGQDLFRWYMKTLDGHTERKNLSISIYAEKPTDTPLGLVRKWDVKRAYPVKWTGPDLKTDAGAITIETLELAHEGIVSFFPE